jgi:hypothetical protein
VLFHDVSERNGDFGVWRLWAELRARWPAFEFEHSHGLGVLAVGVQPKEAISKLCAIAGSEAAKNLDAFFALLGTGSS